MTPHEKSMVRLAQESGMEVQVFEAERVLRVTGVMDEWPGLPTGTIIGMDYTRMDGYTKEGKPKSDTAVLIKRRGEMTVPWTILALNRELRTGFREPTPDDVIRDVLGGIYLEDVPATKEEIAHRKAVITVARAEAKAAKS